MNEELERIITPRTGMYKVSRTSVWNEEVQPCEDAWLFLCLSVDERTTSDPQKVQGWYKNGENHRMVNGHICRDFFRPAWFVEVPDLVEFVREHGTIVLSLDGDFPEIEIYDNYRE